MEKYIKPSYAAETVEANDVILTSLAVTVVGEGTLGEITGAKGQVAMSYQDIFGNK